MMEQDMRIGREVARGAAPRAAPDTWSLIPMFLAELGEDDAPVAPLADADAFAHAAIHAICEAGVAAWEGRRAFWRCRQAIRAGVTVRTVFRHAGKADAIDAIWRERDRLFAMFRAADDKLAALAALPWIGAVTRQRLAQRLGLAGPDDPIESSGEHDGARDPAGHARTGAPPARPHGRRRIAPASLARIGAKP